MNCEITPLGCEFIHYSLDPIFGAKLQVLKLDYNEGIGNDGIKILAQRLGINKLLSLLSLAYCGITAEGSKYLQEILIYQHSQIELVNLSGNQLGNEGIIDVFKGLAANKSLNKVMLADCHWEDSEEVMAAM